MLVQGLFLAALVPAPPNNPNIEPAPLSKTSGLALQDVLLLAGVVAVLGLLLFLWVAITRKNSKQTHTESGARILYRAEHHEHGEHGHRRMRVKKKRRGHPDNLPRNPTLAEAGGLPPIRPDEPSEPAK